MHANPSPANEKRKVFKSNRENNYVNNDQQNFELKIFRFIRRADCN